MVPRGSVMTDHDRLAGYDQDAVNGFPPALLDALVATVAPTPDIPVLEAMAGNGTFTLRLLAWCALQGTVPPPLTVLDRSTVQCARARACLPLHVEVVLGDVLRMHALETGLALPSAHYGTVVIKSGMHELPLAVQGMAAASLWRVLRPGGRLVSLDVLFEDAMERDACAALMRWKDTQAGLHGMAAQRHLCTRAEWYGLLRQAGFTAITCTRACTYRMASAVIAETYWPEETRATLARQWEGEVAQALALRAADRIVWQGTGSVLLVPAEITVATKPGDATC